MHRNLGMHVLCNIEKRLLNLPSVLRWLWLSFSVEHALDCRVGGLVCQRHNEVHNAVCDLASLAWGQVQK